MSGPTIEIPRSPVVVGAATDEVDALLAASATDEVGCRHVRTQPLGGGRVLVELGGVSAGRPGAAASAVRALQALGYAAVAGPPSPGFEVVWARHNAPYWYAPRRCVCFPWSPFDRAEATMAVEIEPGAGFGAGRHPTTVLLLRWLAARPLAGASVLDVGCGTGVLAVAAALAGARRVLALDVAKAALTATTANVARNGVSDRVEVVGAGLASVAESFDVVVANIHAPALIELAPQLHRVVRSGGSLVVSGLSPAQPSTVTAALRPMRLGWECELDDWVALELAK